MRKKILLALLLCLVVPIFLLAQTYDIVIKGGHVIDPKNNIDGTMDIAVKYGKIALVARNIDAKTAVQAVDATGMYVTPGLIDMHLHANERWPAVGPNPIPPDGFTLRVGVTTAVDAGCTGWRTFEAFKKRYIDVSQTRILAFLNIVGEGMRGDPFEQNVKDMLVAPAVACAQKYPEIIVGFKLAHFSDGTPTPVIRGVEAGTLANMPFMIDHGRTQLDSLLLYYLRPGDIYTHCYTRNTGQHIPTMEAARKRGVIFDLGHGGSSFGFENAIPLTKAGFYPDVISTDLNYSSMNGAMKTILNCMDKMMFLGMDLKSIINATTWRPAQIIKHTELGHLTAGVEADIAIFSIRTGKFGLFDNRGNRMDTDKKLECEMTIRAGRIVYNLNGIVTPFTATRSR